MLYRLTLICFCFFCLSSMQAQEQDDHANQVEDYYLDVDPKVDVLPRYKSAECEAMHDEKGRQECAKRALLGQLFTNIRYPSEAKKAGIQGTCFVQFIVEKDGSIDDIKVVKSLHPSIDDEVIRFVDILSDPGTWVPGEVDGKIVRVQFELPVMFKMQ